MGSRRVLFTGLLLLSVGRVSVASTYWDQGPAAPYGPELTARAGHAMAFDSARGRMVLFGGVDDYNLGNGYHNDTWELDASGWIAGPVVSAITPREGHAMAFDSARGRVVLVGGDDYTLPADTWEYDGTTWTKAATGPTAMGTRHAAAMAFDSLRGRSVLFGGYAYTANTDTWEYDGSTWVLGPPAPPGLTARSEHAMAYDVARGRVVLFGGGDGSSFKNDTWEYNGLAWTPGPAAPAALKARVSHGMAYDVARARTVVYGGFDSSYQDRSDTWEYDGTAWTPGPAAPPEMVGRWDHSMAFDSTRNRVVVYGGYGASDEHDDTWEYDGTAWTRGARAPKSLIPRTRHAMVYDSARGAAVVFGGTNIAYGAQYFRNDTWELGVAGWSAGADASFGLGARSDHAMAFDEARARTVLSGGSGDWPPIGDNTWEYDGVAWVMRSSPPPALGMRSGHAMSYDAARGLTVLFGGYVNYLMSDTWEYDGTTWTLGPAAPASLTPRFDHAMAFDSNRGITVLFGGNDGAFRNDVWEYDGLAWLPGPVVSISPVARSGHAMCFHAGRGSVVMFGGSVGGGGFANDTWEYRPCPTITLLPAALPTGVFGTFYSQTFSSVGGSPPHAYEVTAGALPTGMSLSSGGQLAGVPVSVGAHAFTVASTDANGCTGERSYVLNIGCPAITLVPSTLPGATVGVTYGQSTAAGGGKPPYIFNVAAGSLPPGLSLFATGYISGRPTLTGSFSFSVRATDANGCTGVRAYVIAVSCPSITLTPASLPPGIVGQTYNQALQASGGRGPYGFAVTSGALPSALTLSPGGVLAGVPASGGTSSFVVTVTDSAACQGSRAYTLVIGQPDDYVAGAGLGAPNPNRVRVFTGTGVSTGVDFLAYAAGAWGTNVSSGDIDGGDAEILTGPGPGDVLGPQVRAFGRTGAALGKVNYYAYGTLKFGVNVAPGDVDGDAFDEIVTGPGPGDVFGPQVRGWNYDGGTLGAVAKISYFAYATLKQGVNVAGGDVDGDTVAEILTAPGPGPMFGPQVRGWNYDAASIAAIAKINFNALPALQYGANPAGADFDGDAFAEIAATAGPGAILGSRFKGFDFDGAAISALPGFDITPFSTSYGGRVGAGDLDADGSADLIGGAGRDPLADSTVRAWAYDGSQLLPVPGSFIPFAFGTYGVNVAGGPLGW